MNTTEAARLLDLPPDATSEQLETRFFELREKLEHKIANALTPGLKEKYRASLTLVVSAFEILKLADLPVLDRAVPIAPIENVTSNSYSVSPPPLPQRPHSVAKAKINSPAVKGSRRARVAILTGVIIGVLWALVQFAANEGLYRFSMTLSNEKEILLIESVSNKIAWPAEHIYDVVYTNRLQEIVDETLADESLSRKSRSKLKELVARGALSPQHHDHIEIHEIFETLSIDTNLETHMEYLIYGGVCALWGVLVGILAGCSVWIWCRPRPSSIPPPLPIPQ